MFKNMINKNLTENFRSLKKILFNLIKVAVIFSLTISLSEFLVKFNLDKQILVMLYIFSVLIISRLTSGYAYGILAGILLTFAYDYLITEPRMGFSFTIGFPIILCTMLFAALSTSALTNQIKKQFKLALEREQRTLLLYEINQKLLAVRNKKAIIEITNEYLVSHINRPVVFYTTDPLCAENESFVKYPPGNWNEDFFDSETERKIAHEAYVYFQCTEKSTTSYYMPIVSKNRVLGVIGVYAENPLGQHRLLFLKMLAAPVALALELQSISDERNKTLIDAEREKTRSLLLRAISHDLRTPLTSILGASSAILEQQLCFDRDVHDKLITDIKENAQWLIRIVENLLSVTKISHDAMKLDKTLEAAEEVAAQAVAILRKRFPDCRIQVRAPESLLMVPMEATLISQVIINLLENSIKNSETGALILVDIKNNGNYAEFSVSDSGRGLCESMLNSLFESPSKEYAREQDSVDSVRGAGIGLSICSTIIKAHNGMITGRNKPEGGAYFSFYLPLEGESDDREFNKGTACGG